MSELIYNSAIFSEMEGGKDFDTNNPFNKIFFNQIELYVRAVIIEHIETGKSTDAIVDEICDNNSLRDEVRNWFKEQVEIGLTKPNELRIYNSRRAIKSSAELTEDEIDEKNIDDIQTALEGYGGGCLDNIQIWGYPNDYEFEFDCYVMDENELAGVEEEVSLMLEGRYPNCSTECYVTDDDIDWENQDEDDYRYQGDGTWELHFGGRIRDLHSNEAKLLRSSRK